MLDSVGMLKLDVVVGSLARHAPRAHTINCLLCKHAHQTANTECEHDSFASSFQIVYGICVFHFVKTCSPLSLFSILFAAFLCSRNSKGRREKSEMFGEASLALFGRISLIPIRWDGNNNSTIVFGWNSVDHNKWILFLSLSLSHHSRLRCHVEWIRMQYHGAPHHFEWRMWYEKCSKFTVSWPNAYKVFCLMRDCRPKTKNEYKKKTGETSERAVRKKFAIVENIVKVFDTVRCYALILLLNFLFSKVKSCFSWHKTALNCVSVSVCSFWFQ